MNALPMFERNTGEMMLNMVKILLSVIVPNGKENILAVLTDVACNTNRPYQGIVTHLVPTSLTSGWERYSSLL